METLSEQGKVIVAWLERNINCNKLSIPLRFLYSYSDANMLRQFVKISILCRFDCALCLEKQTTKKVRTSLSIIKAVELAPDTTIFVLTDACMWEKGMHYPSGSRKSFFIQVLVNASNIWIVTLGLSALLLTTEFITSCLNFLTVLPSWRPPLPLLYWEVGFVHQPPWLRCPSSSNNNMLEEPWCEAIWLWDGGLLVDGRRKEGLARGFK